MDITALIALSMGAAWASGLNLYAAVAVLGLMGATGSMDLPAGMEMLQNPWVIAAAGAMYVVEFFADKIPGVDSAWDTIHSFIRVPAGAVLAATVFADASTAEMLAAGAGGGARAQSACRSTSGAHCCRSRRRCTTSRASARATSRTSTCGSPTPPSRVCRPACAPTRA